MIIGEVPMVTLFFVAVILLAILVALRGMRMPGNFKKMEDQRMMLRRKILSKRSAAEPAESEEAAKIDEKK